MEAEIPQPFCAIENGKNGEELERTARPGMDSVFAEHEGTRPLTLLKTE